MMKFSRLFFFQHSSKIFFYSFLGFFILQLLFWYKSEAIKPQIDIVPEVPNKYSVAALSLGDKQFYFRFLGTKIQNAGDSFGRFTALKYYDYNKIYQWFTMLDTLDMNSRLAPSLAAYYYSQTQNVEDNRYLIKYLDEHASVDIDKHWWWMFQATMIASATLKDKKLALELAYKMSKNESKDAPLWSKQFPAFIHAELGEECQAFLVISQLLQDDKTGKRKITPADMDFMRYFIKTRLTSLEENNFDPRKCQKKK